MQKKTDTILKARRRELIRQIDFWNARTLEHIERTKARIGVIISKRKAELDRIDKILETNPL